MKDIEQIRRDFPFFAANPGLCYLDNSATSQRPKAVTECLRKFYEEENASPFRGLYDLSVKATDEYEKAREKTAEYIHARESAEIIFTRNTTESMNLLAYSLGDLLLKPGDEVVIGITEHHSNMLPWRQAAARHGAGVVYYYCDKEGSYRPEELKKLLHPGVKILAITQMSNVFGRVNDVKTFARLCHENGTVIVADGAQSVPHIPVDVQDLDVDFLGFSGHKMLSPMGIGVLYGKRRWLDEMEPFMTGGEMIETVSVDRVVYSPLPQKFEAGTVNTAGAIALGAAMDYLTSLGGVKELEKREKELTQYAYEALSSVPHVSIVGSKDPADHHGILTFTVEGVHPHDVSAILSADGICIRAGHHCAQPLHQYLGIMSTSRASLMFYNTKEEIDRFIESVGKLRKEMGYAD